MQERHLTSQLEQHYPGLGHNQSHHFATKKKEKPDKWLNFITKNFGIQSNKQKSCPEFMICGSSFETFVKISNSSTWSYLTKYARRIKTLNLDGIFQRKHILDSTDGKLLNVKEEKHICEFSLPLLYCSCRALLLPVENKEMSEGGTWGLGY